MKPEENVITEGTLDVLADLAIFPEANSRANTRNQGGMKDHAEKIIFSQDESDGTIRK